MEDLEQEKTADDEQEDPTKSGIETGSQSKESSPSAESKPASPTRELLQEEKQQNSADASPRPTRRPRPRRQD